MSTASDELSVAAAQLARAAPQQWDNFKAVHRRFADRYRDQLVKADLNELQKSQGRAQQCALYVALFDDAVNAADRLSERAARKPL